MNSALYDVGGSDPQDKNTDAGAMANIILTL